MSTKYIIKDNSKFKYFISPEYNYVFNKSNGFFARWGATKIDDPEWCPAGCEILDIELSTICNGINGVPCKFCYKTNTGRGENMSFSTFKKVLDNMPKTLTQIAIGIGDIDANPDLWDIMEYTKDNGVIPNITINGSNLKDQYVDNLVKYCGAVAVSRYNPKDVCYDAVKKLTDAGMTQVNIHMLLSEETYDDCFELIDDRKTDPRLAKLKSIVFLHLKPKGKRNTNTVITDKVKYKKLIDYGLDSGISIGFDSCSAPKFVEAVKGRPNFTELEQCAEACESGLFSAYINVKGEYYQCSFCEGEEGHVGIDATSLKFLDNIWYNKSVKEWRHNLINNKDCNGCRKCPQFNIH